MAGQREPTYCTARGPAPDPEIGAFWGRKALGHKVDRPCLLNVVQNLQELWIGMGYLIAKYENWIVFSPKLQILSNAIQGYDVTDIRIVYVFVLSYTPYFHIFEVKYG